MESISGKQSTELQQLQDQLDSINVGIESIDDLMESRLETHEALISQAKSDLKTSQIISELTMEKAEALPKDNKKLHWLSIVTLGITSIVAAARKGWAEERKGAALKLNDANAKLSAGLESVKLPDRAEVQQEDVSYDDFATMQFEQPKVEPVKIEKKNR